MSVNTRVDRTFWNIGRDAGLVARNFSRNSTYRPDAHITCPSTGRLSLMIGTVSCVDTATIGVCVDRGPTRAGMRPRVCCAPPQGSARRSNEVQHEVRRVGVLEDSRVSGVYRLSHLSASVLRVRSSSRLPQARGERKREMILAMEIIAGLGVIVALIGAAALLDHRWTRR